MISRVDVTRGAEFQGGGCDAVGKTGLYGLLVSWKVQAGLVSYIRDGQLPDAGVTRLYFFGSDAKADMYIASDVARW